MQILHIAQINIKIKICILNGLNENKNAELTFFYQLKIILYKKSMKKRFIWIIPI